MLLHRWSPTLHIRVLPKSRHLTDVKGRLVAIEPREAVDNARTSATMPTHTPLGVAILTMRAAPPTVYKSSKISVRCAASLIAKGLLRSGAPDGTVDHVLPLWSERCLLILDSREGVWTPLVEEV